MQLNDTEIWKVVPQCLHLKVSNTGKIYSTFSKRELKLRLTGPDRKKFYSIGYRKEGKSKHLKVHRLVAAAFIPNPDNKPCVNHKDGDKLNNRVENLEWVTISENALHAIETGLNPKRGLDNHNSKLSPEKAVRIRKLFFIGIPQSELARTYGVAQSTISRLIHKRHGNTNIT